MIPIDTDAVPSDVELWTPPEGGPGSPVIIEITSPDSRRIVSEQLEE